MEDIVIIGTGNLAEIALEYLQRDRIANVIAFSVEKLYNKTKNFCGLEVVNFEDLKLKYPPNKVKLLVLIGPNKVNTVRERLYKESKNKGYQFLTYISPKAIVFDKNCIGENCFIFDGCIVEPKATIGVNTIMWSGSIVAHHPQVGAHCFFAPGAVVSGKTRVKENCFIGINATVRDNLVIAKKNIIGCGGVIKKSTKENEVYSQEGTKSYSENSIDTHL